MMASNQTHQSSARGYVHNSTNETQNKTGHEEFAIGCDDKNRLSAGNNIEVLDDESNGLLKPAVSFPEPTQSSIVTIFSIWNTMMGTSILAMPWTLSQAGFGFGVCLIFFVAAIACYTAYLTVQTTEDMRFIRDIARSVHLDITDVAEYHFGKIGRIISLIFSQISILGASIVYYVLLSNFLYFTGQYIYQFAIGAAPPVSNMTDRTGRNFTDIVCPALDINMPTMEGSDLFNSLWTSNRTVPLWLALILFPLVSIKSPTFLGKFSTLASLSVLYIFILIGIKSHSWGINMDDSALLDPVPYFRRYFPSLTGTCSLAFYIHNALQTILRTQRNPENNARDIVVAFGLSTATYTLIGVIFFIVFPVSKLCIEDNILNNLVTDIPVFIGRLGLLLQMSAIYPMIIYILRAQIMHAIFKNIYPSWKHVMALHVLVVGLGILFAIVYPSIGGIIRFIGAICGLVYIFTLPPLLTLMNKRIISHMTVSDITVVNLLCRPESTKQDELLKSFGGTVVSETWNDRSSMVWWWIRCVFYCVIIFIGLLNFFGQFVLLGL